MTISFGQFIPVKVFVDGKEVKSGNGNNIPKPIERVTLTMCDCLIKDKNYPDTFLAEQQRRFFASQVKDYKVPVQSPKNKTNITDSSVKTANIEGQRYLVTGNDIYTYKEYGHQFGIDRKGILDKAEDKIGSEADFMSQETFERTLKGMTNQEIEIAKQDRINYIKRHMRRNERISDKTLYIHAKTNPDAKLERDKYKIALIDFKA
ncbi:MAG: hypothetical protein E7Z91_02265 [Cyanobacteria bacterium SIG30]|nr:hypothetical protein [Cyanobacteria bacterium SIG30]